MIAAVLSPLGRGVAIATVLVGSFVWWLSVHDDKVEQRVVTKIDKVNDNATKLGASAAAGSADRRVSGRRDPTTRND